MTRTLSGAKPGLSHLLCLALGVLAGAAGLAGYERLAPSQAGSAKPALTAARLIAPEMLNVQVAYLEQLTGPARMVAPAGQDQLRTYVLPGCEVTARVRDGAVRGYAADAVPGCLFDLSRLVNAPAPRPDELTYGGFVAALGPGSFRSDCIALCGNAADPTVDLDWDGPHVANYVQVRLTSVLAAPAALNAAEAWRKTMAAQRGEAYVTAALFDCDNSFDDAAAKAFRDVRISRIEVGYGLFPDGPQGYSQCRGRR